MLKGIFNILFFLGAVFAILMGISYLQEKADNKYIGVYNDDCDE